MPSLVCSLPRAEPAIPGQSLGPVQLLLTSRGSWNPFPIHPSPLFVQLNPKQVTREKQQGKTPGRVNVGDVRDGAPGSTGMVGFISAPRAGVALLVLTHPSQVSLQGGWNAQHLRAGECCHCNLTKMKKMYNRICIPFQTDCCKQTFQHLFVTNIIRSLNPFPGWGMFPRGDWSHLSLSFSCYLIVLVQAASCQSYLIFSHLECIATD